MHEGAQRVQSRALDSLELELQMFVRCLVGAGTSMWVLCKSSKHMYTLSHFPSPYTEILKLYF